MVIITDIAEEDIDGYHTMLLGPCYHGEFQVVASASFIMKRSTPLYGSVSFSHLKSPPLLPDFNGIGQCCLFKLSISELYEINESSYFSTAVRRGSGSALSCNCNTCSLPRRMMSQRL